MKTRHIDLPTLGLIAGTRFAMGIGVGLLLSNRLRPEQREGAGWALLTVGTLTTIPLIAEVWGSHAHEPHESHEPQSSNSGKSMEPVMS